MKKIILSSLVLFTCFNLMANVRLPKIFGDNMVLQRGQQIPVWGWADSKEKITIKFNKQTKTVVADRYGKWRINLDNEQAGGPFEMEVTGKNTIRFADVLVGDVWVCSGQSNMEFALVNATGAATEIASANFPQIRHIEVMKAIATKPQDDIKGGEWNVCSPETAGKFTAVGYYFAKKLQKELNVPIGLIHTSWGGTHVETWISREAFEKDEAFKDMIAAMPKMNLDSLAKEKERATFEVVRTLQGSFDNGKTPTNNWKDISLNDSKWPTIQLPALWESKGLPDLDGIVWFRKKITVSEADAGKPAVLELAMIDDADTTYVNGIMVGATNGYNVPRKYTIPAGVLKAGDNLIAIRVLDTGGGGGVYGSADDLKITIGSSTQLLAGAWVFKVASLLEGTTSVGPNSYPTLLFNAMLNPLIPFGIKGAIWYQGESNAGRAFEYRRSFPLMITDWRNRWKEGDFPFYFVQLASYNSANGNSTNGSTWGELREAQTLTLSLPNTGMAVTTDIGNPTDIHPRNKKDVGERLAAVALNKTYKKENVFSGPVFESMKIEGDKAILSFSNTGSGLITKNKYGYVEGFEIAGDNRQFKYAKALIDGNKIIVFQDGISTPVSVRYGWADDASDDNLFNKEGFPAGPFRTDNWKGITDDVHYSVGQ
ncbi:sialate O-acetylesterase [soil metagenome]